MVNRRRVLEWIRTSRYAQDGHQGVGNLPGSIHVAERLYDIRNLRIHGRIENPITAADHGLLIIRGIPGKRNPGRKVLLVCIERAILRIQFVAQAVVQGEIGPDSPRVLPVSRRERPVLSVVGIAKALLIEGRQANSPRLQRADGSRSGGREIACDRLFQTGAEQIPRQIQELETSREECVGGGVISANQLVEAHPHGMVAANEAEVVGQLVATCGGVAG